VVVEITNNFQYHCQQINFTSEAIAPGFAALFYKETITETSQLYCPGDDTIKSPQQTSYTLQHTKKTKKYFRSTKSGAGMTTAGVKKYRKDKPGSKLKTAVTGKVKPGSKAAKRRKSYCARSAGQMKQFPKSAANPKSRLRQARKRWNC